MMTLLQRKEQRVLRLIRGVLQKRKNDIKGARIVLFGSRARGNAKITSDFDLGIIRKKPLPLDVFFDIEEDLQNLPTLSKIELIDLKRTPPSFRKIAGPSHSSRLHPIC